MEYKVLRPEHENDCYYCKQKLHTENVTRTFQDENIQIKQTDFQGEQISEDLKSTFFLQ